MKTVSWILSVPVAAALTVAATHYFNRHTRVDDWEQRAAEALTTANAERTRADSLETLAAAAMENAAAMVEQADERGARVGEWVEVVREVRVPDSCISFVAPRDSVIDTLFIQVDTWRGALLAQTAASAALLASNHAQGVVIDSLGAVLLDRPRPRRAWLPELGVGVWMGICTSGRPCLGVGAGLTWRVGF